MKDQPGVFPDRVKGPMLLASDISLKSCGGGLVGVDFLATDGSVFAHGHFDVAVAKRFHTALGLLIAQAAISAALGVSPGQDEEGN